MDNVNHNFAVLVLASVIFGLSVGIYDLLFPYYLDDLGLSFGSMGITFSIAALVVAFATVYTSSVSDVMGRKIFYSLGIGLGSVSAAMLPVFNSLPMLVVAKTLREGATRFRGSLHGVLIFEFARNRFVDLFAKSRGIEFLSEGSGQLMAGVLLVSLGFAKCFYFAAALLGVSLTIFFVGFREPKGPVQNKKPPGLRETFSPDLSKQLMLLAASSFIFSVGLSTSHNFIMPLFFAKKFGATVGQVSLILGLHRLSLAVPLLFSGMAIRWSLKRIYIFALLFEGITLSLTGLMPGLLASAGIFLMHDLFGAAFWMPVQAILIQHYARDRFRGKDVSKVMAIGFLGWIFGPLIAGWTSPVSLSLPFILSGILVASAIIPILLLRDPPAAEREIILGKGL